MDQNDTFIVVIVPNGSFLIVSKSLHWKNFVFLLKRMSHPEVF